MRSSTYFRATKQRLVWEMDYNSPSYPHTVPTSACEGGSGQKEQLQCLNLLEKQGFGGADFDSTRAAGNIRQIAKPRGFWLEASTASHSCACGHMLSMLLPYMPWKLLGKKAQ